MLGFLVVIISAVVAPAASAPVGPAGFGGAGMGGPLTAIHDAKAYSSGDVTPYTSAAWSGYFAEAPKSGTAFTSIHAQWVQQPVTCKPLDIEWALFWAGLDGWGDHIVEQGGSDAYCFLGIPVYSLWWEMYPSNIPQIGPAISPGDTISSTVTYEPASKSFSIVVKDLTNGQSMSENEPCAADMSGCPRVSAEVVSEAPESELGSTALYNLPDYGTTNYSSATVTDDAGNTGTFGSPQWNTGQVQEVDSSGRTMQTTSDLRSAGSSFSTTWAATN